jgi:hypothetical protein
MSIIKELSGEIDVQCRSRNTKNGTKEALYETTPTPT